MNQLVVQVDEQSRAAQLAEAALGVEPLGVIRQSLSESGNSVYQLLLPNDQSAVLRISPKWRTFWWTRNNLEALEALEIPVQSVLASGALDNGGSYIILSWIPGRDLIHELPEMSRPQMTRLAEQVTQFQRRVGSLQPSRGFGWAAIGQEAPLAAWTDIFGKTISEKEVDDGTQLGDYRVRLCRLRSRIESYFATVRARPFLDDLTIKNVLVEGGTLTGIIDIDFVCYGDPLLSIGITMASLAADAPESAAFYGEELARCAEAKGQQQLALLFFAALWAVGIFSMNDPAKQPDRAQSLSQAIERWLSEAEGS